MTTTETVVSDSLRNEQTFLLAELGAAHIDEILDAFGIKFRRTNRYAYFACPIHNGDNPSGVTMYYDGYKVKGYWRCNTKKCHEKYGAHLLGFIRGMLQGSWQGAVEWLEDFLGVKSESIELTKDYLDRKAFFEQTRVLYKQLPSQRKKGVTREYIRSQLKIPSEFYLDKGFSEQILDLYDVGLCSNPEKEMFGRVVFPIYELGGGYIGCVARSILPPCSLCGLFHTNQCPNNYFHKYTKWVNSANFEKTTFYNYHKAADAIRSTGTAVLVEGQADCLRLVQGGLYNAIGLFGVDMTEDQELLLERSGALKIVLLLDNDGPGRTATDKLRERLKPFYRVIVPNYDGKDPDSLTMLQIDQLKKVLNN